MPPLGGMQIRHHCQAKAATGKGEDFHVSHPDCVWPGDRSDAASLGLCGAPVHFALFGVFDGHGGQATGKHCRDALLREFLAALDARVFEHSAAPGCVLYMGDAPYFWPLLLSVNLPSGV